MNEVASKCCGSCKLYVEFSDICAKHQDFVLPSHFSCGGKDYIPVNPTPLIDVLEVKEMVEDAYRAGYGDGNTDSGPVDDKCVKEYMKDLVAGNER